VPVFKCSPEGGNISSGLSHVSNPTSLTLQALLMLDNYLSSQSISLRCWSVVTRHWSVQSRGQWARSSIQFAEQCEGVANDDGGSNSGPSGSGIH